MIRHNRPTLPGLDGPAIMQEARKLLAPRIEQPARRAFLRRTLSLGGLALLSGCSLSDDESVEQALAAVSRFNDRVQGWIFDPAQLAPTSPESMITRPFPFNAYHGIEAVPQVDGAGSRLALDHPEERRGGE